jgi:hypothetical protein
MAASRWMVTRWRVTIERHNDLSPERVFWLALSVPIPPAVVAGGRTLSRARSVPLKHGLGRRRLLGRRWWGGGPDLGGAPGGAGLMPGCSAGAGERVECLRDAFGGEVAVRQVAELGAGEPVGGAGQGGVDLFGERVAGCVVDRPGCGAGGLVPERERGGQVFGSDRVGGVEQRVEEREPDRVRLGAGGELAGGAVGGLGELRVGVPLQLAGVVGELDRPGSPT